MCLFYIALYFIVVYYYVTLLHYVKHLERIWICAIQVPF